MHDINQRARVRSSASAAACFEMLLPTCNPPSGPTEMTHVSRRRVRNPWQLRLAGGLVAAHVECPGPWGEPLSEAPLSSGSTRQLCRYQLQPQPAAGGQVAAAPPVAALHPAAAATMSNSSSSSSSSSSMQQQFCS
jgi:hypothetical protein